MNEDEYLCMLDDVELSLISDPGESQAPELSETGNESKTLENFVDIYESLPQLWNPTHPGYMKKDCRNHALDKLLPTYRKIKSGATRDDVRRKINTLRSNYRKELKKILDSKRSGTSPDMVYQPTSWLFYALKFLSKFEKPANSTTNQLSDTTETDVLHDEAQTSSHSSIYSPPPPKRHKRLNQGSKQDELLQMACNYLEQSSTQKKEQNIPTVAIAWGETLNTLDPIQRIYAEKAINEILFEARLGKLNASRDITPSGFISNSTIESSSSQPYQQEQAPSPISVFFKNYQPNK